MARYGDPERGTGNGNPATATVRLVTTCASRAPCAAHTGTSIESKSSTCRTTRFSTGGQRDATRQNDADVGGGKNLHCGSWRACGGGHSVRIGRAGGLRRNAITVIGQYQDGASSCELAG